MNEYKNVIFHHGAFADDYETQANKQGYTFVSRADWMQKIGYGIVCAHINGIITSTEYDKIMRRFTKFLAGYLTPYKEGAEE